jgi:hypothetical protein
MQSSGARPLRVCLAQRQGELIDLDVEIAAARNALAAQTHRSFDERRGVLAAVDAVTKGAEADRFAARAAAAEVLRDIITEVRCYRDGSVVVWYGDYGFRVRFSGREAWIEGGLPAGDVTLSFQWERRDGQVLPCSLPPS